MQTIDFSAMNPDFTRIRPNPTQPDFTRIRPFVQKCPLKKLSAKAMPTKARIRHIRRLINSGKIDAKRGERLIELVGLYGDKLRFAKILRLK